LKDKRKLVINCFLLKSDRVDPEKVLETAWRELDFSSFWIFVRLARVPTPDGNGSQNLPVHHDIKALGLLVKLQDVLRRGDGRSAAQRARGRQESLNDHLDRGQVHFYLILFFF
jgi:hypothetical protein